MSRLWDKGESLDSKVLRYTAGEDHLLDHRLIPYDIRASIAHADMLHAAGYLDREDHDRIVDGLTDLGETFAAGEWSVTLEDEDGHTALETNLTKKIGKAGERIHLGRSRNDQVLVALRLYLLDAVDTVESEVQALSAALTSLADRQGELALPGVTHMQHAMPSSVELWALGFRAQFEDGIAGLQQCRRRIDQNPLGSAAGYGTPGLQIDREMTTESLGFTATQSPVTAVQLSRGKAEAGFLFELSLIMNDLGRLATDLLLFYTQEFSYIDLPDEMTTGSSIMPQKRNPDVLELVRAAAGSVQSCLDECLAITAKLPSGFQRDLQRLKAPLFRAIDLTIDSVDIMSHLLGKTRFNADNIRLDDSLYAAEAANRLVIEEGIPFREAYRRIAAERKS